MTLDFNILCPQIENIFKEIETEYQTIKGLILTEDDLKCLLYKKLTSLPALSKPTPTQNGHILGSSVHAEVSWYGENESGPPRRLSIKPDITILEPEHMSILQGYMPLSQRSRDTSLPASRQSNIYNYDETPRLPSKQFVFAGKAIIFELKFARRGMNEVTLRSIKDDYDQIMRLFSIFDNRGDGNSIFSYLVIFDKYQSELISGPFAEFLREHGNSFRHKVVYKTGKVPNLPVQRRLGRMSNS